MNLPPRSLVILLVSSFSLAACQGGKSKVPPEKSRQKERDTVPVQPVDESAEYTALLASLTAPKEYAFDASRATELAELSLDCVNREYPNKPGHVVDGDETVKPPRELHPAFFGCFDWHSAVHGHWAMVRVLKTFPKIEIGAKIREVLKEHLNAEKLKSELEYFRGTHHDLFERPYGWGWLLRLKAELDTFEDPQAKIWAQNLKPLTLHLSKLLANYLEILSVPVRAGTHHSTAFALTHAYDYAVVAGDTGLKEVIERRARFFYGRDVACPTEYEPSGEDFISPCLKEADLMRRVLDRAEFASWLKKFLPNILAQEFRPLFTPPKVNNREDPRIGHLIGLSLGRAASYRGIARALPDDDPRRPVFFRLADIHRDDGLNQLFKSGYGGAHWLASFAVYLLTDAGPYV